VTLVDGDNVASGATGDSSAILRHQYYGNELYAEMARLGREFYEAFEEHTGQPLATADSPLVGFLREGTDSAERFERGYNVVRDLGLPASRYEREDLADRYPLFDFPDEGDFAISDDAAGYSDAGRVDCDHVVLAAGRWSGQLAETVGVDGESDLFDLDHFALDRFEDAPTDEIYAESL
jgi:glycine/D-amino acid oxidase-like deaminating enzyme